MRDPVVELPGKKAVSSAGDVRESRGVLGLALVELVSSGGGAAEWRTLGTYGATGSFTRRARPGASRSGRAERPADPGDLAIGQALGVLSRDNDVGTLPGTVQGEEGSLSRHPLVPETRRLLVVTIHALGDVAPDPALLGDVVIGLDPHVGVDQAVDGAHTRPAALHDDQRTGRDIDRPLHVVGLPGRGHKVEDTGMTQLGKCGHKQVVPLVEGLVPGQVVNAQDLGTGVEGRDRSGEVGLACSSAPVDGKDRRIRKVVKWADQVEQVPDEGRQSGDVPGGHRRLLGLEGHRQSRWQGAYRSAAKWTGGHGTSLKWWRQAYPAGKG